MSICTYLRSEQDLSPALPRAGQEPQILQDKAVFGQRLHSVVLGVFPSPEVWVVSSAVGSQR